MRHESQQRTKIHAKLEVVFEDDGQTGLSPTALIKRVNDGLYWSGAVWQVAATTVAMTEVDSTNQPGLYWYDLPSSGVDLELGADGYEMVLVETTNEVRENVFVTPVQDVSSEDVRYLFPTTPAATEKVQLGTTKSVQIGISSSPVQYGKAGAFTLDEAILTMVSGGTVVDYSAVIPSSFTDELIEMGNFPPSGAYTSMTADPVYSAAGGPSGENVYELTVFSSAAFSVNQYVRARGSGFGSGHIHKILEIPDGTTLVVHSSEDAFDIIDGDVIERVIPSGIYIGAVDVDVDTYFSADDPTAELRLVITGRSTLSPDPTFDSDSQLVFVRMLELDLSSRTFRMG